MVWQRDIGIQTQTPRHFDVEFVVVGAKGDPKFINSLSCSMGGEAELKMGFNGACGASLAGPSVKPGEFYRLMGQFAPGPKLGLPESGPKHFPPPGLADLTRLLLPLWTSFPQCSTPKTSEIPGPTPAPQNAATTLRHPSLLRQRYGSSNPGRVDDTERAVGARNHNRLKSQVQSIASSTAPPAAVEGESAGLSDASKSQGS